MSPSQDMKALPFAGEGVGDLQWVAFPFDTPDLFFKIELTSQTIGSNDFGGVFKKWKIRYNLHEFQRAKKMSLKALALIRRVSLNGGANDATAPTVPPSQFSSFTSQQRHAQDMSVVEEVRRKLHQTRAMISFKQFSDNMPCFDIMHSGVSVKFPPEKKKVRPSSFLRLASQQRSDRAEMTDDVNCLRSL